MELSTLTLKASPYRVIDIATHKRERRIHLPDLQRGFVWSPDRVRALHDSLYRRYPIGALLLWKPTWEGSDAPVVTRAWDLFPVDAVTGRGTREPLAPIQSGSLFVLDGQQRLTSLFRVIFRSRIKDRTTPDPDLLVALSPDEEWVREPFHLRSRSIHRKMKDGLLIPAEVLFEGIRGGNESLAVQKAIGEWVSAKDELFFKALDRANSIRNSILQTEIVAYEIDADADDDNVIEIFARLNQQGVRLRPADLAAARLTGQMKNFRSKATTVLHSTGFARYAAPEGKEEGLRSGGLVDTDLLIRAAVFLGSGLVRYRDLERGGPRGSAYTKVEGGWDVAVKGFQGAIDLFRSAGIPDGAWLPSKYLLLPPAIAFARGQTLGPKWVAWAILASLWRHYVGEVDTKLQRDCGLAEKGDIDGLLNHVQVRAKRLESVIPEEEDFANDIVNEAGVFLAAVCRFSSDQTRSFPGGKLISKADEPLEIHHLFPRAVLDTYPLRDNEFVPDVLGNLTILTRSDNEHLGDTQPDIYLPTVDEADRKAHFIPEDRDLWRLEKYPMFCLEREKLLAQAVRALLQRLLT